MCHGYTQCSIHRHHALSIVQVTPGRAEAMCHGYTQCSIHRHHALSIVQVTPGRAEAMCHGYTMQYTQTSCT